MQEVTVETDGPATSIGSDSDMPTASEENQKKSTKEKGLPGKSADGTIKASNLPTGSGDVSVAAASSVDKVLQLHTSRRMKPSRSRVGVSIPSQRRWLRYWSEFLHGTAPPQLPLYPEGGGAQVAIVRMANALIERAPRSITGKDYGAENLWASLARYEDAMVEEIEKRVRNGDEIEYEDDQVTRKNNMFATSNWDNKKMVKGFARMGLPNGEKPESRLGAEGTLLTYNLLPLPPSEWVEIGEKMAEEGITMTDVQINDGVLLRSGREIRIKLYMGQVCL